MFCYLTAAILTIIIGADASCTGSDKFTLRQDMQDLYLAASHFSASTNKLYIGSFGRSQTVPVSGSTSYMMLTDGTANCPVSLCFLNYINQDVCGNSQAACIAAMGNIDYSSPWLDLNLMTSYFTKATVRIRCDNRDDNNNIYIQYSNNFFIWMSSCFDVIDTSASMFVPYQKMAQITGTKTILNTDGSDWFYIPADDGTNIIFEYLKDDPACPQIDPGSCTFTPVASSDYYMQNINTIPLQIKVRKDVLTHKYYEVIMAYQDLNLFTVFGVKIQCNIIYFVNNGWEVYPSQYTTEFKVYRSPCLPSNKDTLAINYHNVDKVATQCIGNGQQNMPGFDKMYLFYVDPAWFNVTEPTSGLSCYLKGIQVSLSSNSYVSPDAVFESDTTTEDSGDTSFRVLKVKTMPITTDIEFYIYKIKISPYDSQMELDPPPALRTKKLVITKMLTQDSGIFGSSYTTYSQFVLNSNQPNYVYKIPLQAFTQSACSFDYIELATANYMTAVWYYPNTWSKYGTYTSNCGGSLCSDITINSHALIEFKFVIRFCHYILVPFANHPTLNYEQYGWVRCGESSPVSVELTCGSETVTLNSDYDVGTTNANGNPVSKQLDFLGLVYDSALTTREWFGAAHNPSSEILKVARSDLEPCPPNRYKMYKNADVTQWRGGDSKITLVESHCSFDGSSDCYLEFGRSTVFDETIYLKASTKSDNNQYVVIPIRVQTCGAETFSTTQTISEPIEFIFGSVELSAEIKNSQIQPLFSPTNDPNCPIYSFILENQLSTTQTIGAWTGQLVSSTDVSTTSSLNNDYNTWKITVDANKVAQNTTLLGMSVVAISSGNVKVSQSITVTIQYVNPLCTYSILRTTFQQSDLKLALKEIPFGTQNLVYEFVEFKPFDATNVTDLSLDQQICNYKMEGVNNVEQKVINRVDYQLTVYKYNDLDYTVEPTLYVRNVVSIDQNSIELQPSYTKFTRTQKLTFNTSDANYGKYKLQISSVMEVDLLPTSFVKPSAVYSYDFDVQYCQIKSYKDLSSDQKAMGNSSVLEYWFQNGSIKVESPFVGKFDVEFEESILRHDCRDHYLIFQEINWNFVAKNGSDVSGITLKERQSDEKDPKILDSNLLPNFVSFDDEYGQFWMNSKTKQNLGVFQVQMTVYSLLFKREKVHVDKLYNRKTHGNYNSWIKKQGERHSVEQNFFFYIDSRREPFIQNTAPYFVEDEEIGGHPLELTFNATQEQVIEEYILPPIRDDEGDETLVSFSPSSATKYVNYNRFRKSLVFSELSKNMEDDFTFEIVLKDIRVPEQYSRKSIYSILVSCTYCKKPENYDFLTPNSDQDEVDTKIENNETNLTKEVPNYKLKPPKMYVKPIKNDGTFTIKFSKPMKYPHSWYKKVEQDSQKSKERFQELLQESIEEAKETEENSAEDPSLSLDFGFRRQLRRGSLDLNIFMDYQDPKMEDKIQIESYMVALYPTQIEYQIYFTNPKLVSMSHQSEKDKLKIKLPPALLTELVDSESNQQLNLDNYDGESVITKRIPAQLGVSQEAINLKTQANTTDGALKLMFFVNILLAFTVQFSLNYLWSVINCIQMIVYLPLLNITFPANANAFFGVIIKVATFDIVPKIDDINEALFSFEHTVDNIDQESFESIDISSKNFINNSGSLYLYQAFLMTHLLTIIFLKKYGPYSNFLITLYRKIVPKQTFSNIFLRFLMESYLELFLVSLINAEYFSKIDIIFTNLSDAFAFLLAVINTIFVFSLPLLIASLAALKIDILERKEMDDEDLEELGMAERLITKYYGTLFGELKEDSNLALNHNYIYVLRRLLFVLLAFYLDDYPNFQISFCIVVQFIQLAYLIHTQPFKTNQMNYIEQANETTLLLMAYSLLVLTDFVPNIPVKFQVGYFMISLTVFIIILNIISVCKDLYRQNVLRKRKEIYEKRHRELLQTIMNKYSVRQQHLIKRKMKSEKSIKELRDQDLRTKRRFQKKYIANYSLSDIPEEEERMEQGTLKTEKLEVMDKRTQANFQHLVIAKTGPREDSPLMDRLRYEFKIKEEQKELEQNALTLQRQKQQEENYQREKRQRELIRERHLQQMRQAKEDSTNLKRTDDFMLKNM